MPLKKLAVKKLSYFLIIFSGLFIISCSSSKDVYYVLPPELKDKKSEDDFISKYSPYLSGKKIFLDPGHGGIDRKSIGPNLKIVEADINLKVALELKSLLERAGVEVVASRYKDITVELKERSLMANRSGSDIFISIHHNAPGNAEDNWTNYTSTYYHAKEGDYEYEPSERDLARYLQRDLAYAMRNSGGPGSFDGTYSDYNIYPGEGFSVLRLTEIPAVLVEAAFFTNDYEEQRLAIEEFNRIEAWGIFKGLCRYFAAGIPQIEPMYSRAFFLEGDLFLTFSIKDKYGIDPSSIRVQFDSVYVIDSEFDVSNGILSVPVPGVEPGNHVLRIIAANINGNHAFPFHQDVIVFSKSGEF